MSALEQGPQTTRTSCLRVRASGEKQAVCRVEWFVVSSSRSPVTLSMRRRAHVFEARAFRALFHVAASDGARGEARLCLHLYLCSHCVCTFVYTVRMASHTPILSAALPALPLVLRSLRLLCAHRRPHRRHPSPPKARQDNQVPHKLLVPLPYQHALLPSRLPPSHRRRNHPLSAYRQQSDRLPLPSNKSLPPLRPRRGPPASHCDHRMVGREHQHAARPDRNAHDDADERP